MMKRGSKLKIAEEVGVTGCQRRRRGRSRGVHVDSRRCCRAQKEELTATTPASRRVRYQEAGRIFISPVNPGKRSRRNAASGIKIQKLSQSRGETRQMGKSEEWAPSKLTKPGKKPG
ncbi:hypothetical protein Bca4012_065785 [Brassica carinata]|uniref:Uncharacterized protein n=1 Tax=Brassica carinata TaxID=52824 RepID=A0A8X8AZ26_BRACI|nr:hypothetical protein Bca52824_018104 [Brassica carinata]